MELVYLWIEKYKNIKNQEFNFSPKFNCKFDGKKISINKNENYVNIFPENINVTAIIGENGSGKSSILKLLHKSLIIWEGKGFALFANKENKIFYLSGLEKYPFLDKYEELYSDERIISFPLFDYSFTYDQDLNYSTLDNVYPKKEINSLKGFIDLKKELFNNQKNILLNYLDLKKLNLLKNFKSFFIPKTVNIFFNTRSIQKKESSPNLIKTAEIELLNLKDSISNNIDTEEFIVIIKKIKNILSNPNSYEPLLSQFDYFDPTNVFQLGENFTDEDTYSNLWNNTYRTFETVNLDKVSKVKKIESISSNETWIEESDYLIYSFDIDSLDQQLVEDILVSFSSYQFTIQVCDKNKKALNDLSFGEQQLIFILNQLYSLKNNELHGIENITYEGQEHEIEVSKNINSFIILLDEIDIGWHPDWQKKMISYIFDFLKNFTKKNFHIIISTHSPFILSDIPKENTIFLKNGESKKVDINTFGANIHTLLSHGFFMKGGLMGNFAKSRIDKVIELLNQSGSLIDKEIVKCEEIISIIGEPILKRQLQKMLDSKRLKSLDGINKKIEDMEYELSVLKKYQERSIQDEINNEEEQKKLKEKRDV